MWLFGCTLLLSWNRAKSLIDDFKRALKEVRQSVRPWFDTAKNYALFSNEGGLYDDLLVYLRSRHLV